MPNSDVILGVVDEEEHFYLPAIIPATLTNGDSAIKAALKFYQKAGLVPSGLECPAMNIVPHKLFKLATLGEAFTSNGSSLDDNCLTVEQSILFISNFRHWIIKDGNITCCFLLKIDEQYKAVCLSMWPSWYENLTIRFVRSNLLVPFQNLSVNQSGAKSQEDCLGMIGDGNAILQIFPVNHPELLSPEMNIIVLLPSCP